jgi:hypothetical protein
LVEKIMKNESTNICRKPRDGPRGAWWCALMISIAAALFTAAATGVACWIAPQDMPVWVNADAVWVWKMPGIVPALIALQVMGLWLALAAPVLLLYGGIKRLVRRAADSSAETVKVPRKTSVVPAPAGCHSFDGAKS